MHFVYINIAVLLLFPAISAASCGSAPSATDTAAEAEYVFIGEIIRERELPNIVPADKRLVVCGRAERDDGRRVEATVRSFENLKGSPPAELVLRNCPPSRPRDPELQDAHRLFFVRQQPDAGDALYYDLRESTCAGTQLFSLARWADDPPMKNDPLYPHHRAWENTLTELRLGREQHDRDCRLFAAVQEGSVLAAERLLKRGANPNSLECGRSSPGRSSTAIEQAILQKDAAMTKLLSEHGAVFYVNIQEEDMESLRQGEVFKSLIESGSLSTLDALRSSGLIDLAALNCALHPSWYGLERLDAAGLQALFDRGLPLRCAPIQAAVGRGDHRAIEVMLQQPSYPSSKRELLGRGAAKAVEQSNVKMIKHFIELGADASPHLRAAILHKDTRMLRLLLSYGADPNHPSLDGRKSPLAYAAQYANDKAVRLLLKHGANVNAQDDRGRTPLGLLVANNRYFDSRPVSEGPVAENAYQSARMLIRYGADADIRDRDGKTVFEIALDSYDTDLSRRLIEDFLAARMPRGLSYSELLRRYACSGNTELVEFLLSQDADPFEPGPDGRSAMDMNEDKRCFYRPLQALWQGGRARMAKPPRR